MRAIRCAVAALLVAGIVAVVGAQPGGQGGRGGGQTNLASLVLTNVALQEELKVTAEQKEKFKPAAEKQTEMNKKFREAFGGGKFDKEKMADLNKEREKLTEEVKKVTDEVLTADQKKRIKQISVQMLGVGVFGEPREGKGGFGGTSEAEKAIMKDVVETLKLTDEQKTKVKEIVSDYNKDRTAIRTDIFGEKGGFGKQDPAKTKEFTEKTGKLSEDTMAKIAGALTDEQKKAWKDLTGEKFDLTKLAPVAPKKD